MRLLVIDRIADKNSVGSLVVGGGKGPETKTESVPNLDFTLFAVDFDGLDSEVAKFHRSEALGEHVLVCETTKQGSLSDIDRANQHNFEDVVAIRIIKS